MFGKTSLHKLIASINYMYPWNISRFSFFFYLENHAKFISKVTEILLHDIRHIEINFKATPKWKAEILLFCFWISDGVVFVKPMNHIYCMIKWRKPSYNANWVIFIAYSVVFCSNFRLFSLTLFIYSLQYVQYI